MDLADFKTQTCMISLFCHFFFSCINTVYSLFYRMHMEKVNGLIHFSFGYSQQGDWCCREYMSRRQSRRKEATDEEREEESGGLSSTGSKKWPMDY